MLRCQKRRARARPAINRSKENHSRRRWPSRTEFQESSCSLQFHWAQRRCTLQHSRRLQFSQQSSLVTVATRHVKLDSHMLTSTSAHNILHHAMLTLQDAVDLLPDLFHAGTGNFVTNQQGLQVKSSLRIAQSEERQQNYPGGKNRSKVKPATRGNSHRGDYEQRGRCGQARR